MEPWCHIQYGCLGSMSTAMEEAHDSNIGGQTIHSWAGIGMGDKQIDELVAIITRCAPLNGRWTETQTLIIDEGTYRKSRRMTVSMLDGKVLDLLDNIGRRVRRSNEPFGGIQVSAISTCLTADHCIRRLSPARACSTRDRQGKAVCFPK